MIGPDDILPFFFSYVPSFALALLAIGAILTGAFVQKRRKISNSHLLWLIFVPPVCWVAYFVMTCEFAWTTTLLDSESSRTAERAYQERLKVQVQRVDDAINIAVSTRYTPNVRFYASCLIADILLTNSDAVIQKTLTKVDDTPIIATEFFDGNSLTDGFYIPGRVQPQLTVRKIVSLRLRTLRENEEAKKPR